VLIEYTNYLNIVKALSFAIVYLLRQALPGESRVLRVCGRTLGQVLLLTPPVVGALGIIGVSGKASLIS
jgi:hypothetical protein